MRAADTFTESPFTVKRLEDFIPQNHPLRPIRKMVNEALGHLERLLSGVCAPAAIPGRSTRDCPGETAARDAAAGGLQHPVGAPTYGSDSVQPALSLVHWFSGLAIRL
jgi:hypothetical protein